MRHVPVLARMLAFVHASQERRRTSPKGLQSNLNNFRHSSAHLCTCVTLQVKVVVGKPIAMVDLLQAAEAHAWSEDTLYTAIANVSGMRD
eukprot:1145358-Pelagomonas_calceolata.AAC.3